MPPRAIRIEEHISGRKYRIEVAPVSPGKWRAQVLAAHGGPTALMPFYGTTPERAAKELTNWLTRVNRSKVPSA